LNFDVVMVGTILNEIVRFPTKTVGPVLGSPAAYGSVASARLGMKTGIVTKIGTDMPSELLRPFREAGVDTLGMHISDATTTNYLVYDQNGNKTLQYVKKAPPLYPSDIPDSYMSSRVIHICPIDYEVPLETVQSLRQRGVRLSVDLGGYGGATSVEHPVDDAEKRALVLNLMRNFDVIRASAEDCRHIFGEKEDLDEFAAEEFLRSGASVAIVTLGEKGVMARSKEDGTHRIRAYPAQAVDPTGAGDVFTAGFLAEFIRTDDLRQALLFGSAASSIVVEKTGGVLPSRMPASVEVYDRMLRYTKLLGS
jgi:sugar/nucleoside kinase (ribokinase family)